MRKSAIALLTTVALNLPGAAAARDILLVNDDGLTSNVVALYKALKEEGHDVIVSVPCRNQSGMGAALKIAQPILPLKENCLNDAAKAGEPGAGKMTREGLGEDFHYVDGTPVMAAMYGIDVVGQARWKAQPDLVLSGPNEGQNVGAIVLSSGTVSAAQYSAIAGIPAIALSAGQATTDNEKLANPDSKKVAALSVQLVAALDKSASGNAADGNGRMLPKGMALNVNFPNKLDNRVGWRMSKIGSYNGLILKFSDNMAEDASPAMKALAKMHGADVPPLPGLAIDLNTARPTKEQMNDEAIVISGNIAISPMQAGYAFGGNAAEWMKANLADLLPKGEENSAEN